MGRLAIAVLRGAAYAFTASIGFAGGCSLTTLDFVGCRSDADCAVSVGEDHLCSADGYCRSQPELPGRCSGDLEVRLLAELSGPNADVGLPFFKGQLDLIRQINEEGGVRGCPILVRAVDAKSDDDAARDALTAWMGEPTWELVSTVFVFGTEESLLLSPDLAAEEVLLMSGSAAGALASPGARELDIEVPSVNDSFEERERDESKTTAGHPYAFFAGADESTVGRAAIDLANKEGARKVAFAVCDGDACERPLAAVRTHAAAELGLDLGRDLAIDPDASAAEIEQAVMAFYEQELQQQSSDDEYDVPDWLWIGLPSIPAARVAVAVGRVRDDLGLDVQVVTASADERFAERCGGGCQDHVWAVAPFAAYGNDVPGMARVEDLHDRWRVRDAEGWNGNPAEVDGDDDPLKHDNIHYVRGHVSVLLWQRALERVIDFEKAVEGKSIKDVLENVSSYELGGLTPPVSYSRTDHRPNSTVRVYRIDEDGELSYDAPDPSVALEEDWIGW